MSYPLSSIPCSFFLRLSLLSSSVAYFASGRSRHLPPCSVFILLSLLSSGVRPAYTNNRVPVLQRCGVQREPLSQGQLARDGVRSESQGALKDGTRKGTRESEGGHCVPPSLTPAKGYPEEKGSSDFGSTRKRPLGPMTEQEDMEREEGGRVSHPEKRAKISGGENFICFLCIRLILPTPFPSSCLMLNPASALVVFQKYLFLFVASSFPINATLNQLHHKSRPPSQSLSHLSLCVAASSEKCLILPLSGVQERSEEEGQPFSLFSFSSAVSMLRLPTLFKAALFFSFHLLSFFPLICLGFLFSPACGIALSLPGTGRRVKYLSP